MLDLKKKFNDTNGIYDEYNRMPYHDSNNHMNVYDNPPKDLYRAPYDPMNISDGVIRGTSRADYSPLKKSLAITALLSIAVVLIAKLFAGNVVPIGFGLLFSSLAALYSGLPFLIAVQRKRSVLSLLLQYVMIFMFR